MSTKNQASEVYFVNRLDGKLENVTMKYDNKKIQFATIEEMDKEKLETLLIIVLNSLELATMGDQKTLIQVLKQLYLLFSGYASNKRVYMEQVCRSNFHETSATFLTTAILTGKQNAASNLQKELYENCLELNIWVSDESTEFVQHIWSTNIIEQLIMAFQNPEEHNILNQNHVLILLSNIIKRSTVQQREILSCGNFINSLMVLSHKCIPWGKLVVVFSLSMLVDETKISLIDNETATLSYALSLMRNTWESNLRRHEGYSLFELLNGLYYLLRSNEMKMSFLNQENIDFLINIMTDCNDQEELISSLAVLKQLIRDDAVKLKLVREFKMTDRLNHFLTETHFPNVKMVVNDIIDTLHRVQQ